MNDDVWCPGAVRSSSAVAAVRRRERCGVASSATRRSLHVATRGRGFPTQHARERLHVRRSVDSDHTAAYARTVIRLIADRGRDQQATPGPPTKLGRTDGHAPRVIAAWQNDGRDAAPWLVALFRMRQGSSAVGRPTRGKLCSDIARVVRTAADVLSESRVLRRLCPVIPAALLPIAPLDTGPAEVVGLVVLVMGRDLRTLRLAARRRGRRVLAARRAAVPAVADTEAPPLPLAVRRPLTELDVELVRAP